MNLVPILPLIILAGTSILIILLTAVKRSYNTSFVFNLMDLSAAFIFLFYTSKELPQSILNFLRIENYVIFFIGLLIAGSFMAKRVKGRKKISSCICSCFSYFIFSLAGNISVRLHGND